jgi:glycoside/pentoside/hexuronide:cation symporter, GPH family
MRLLMSGIPVIGLVIALIFVLRLQLDQKRMGEIRTELEGRRGTV